jgi:mRNA interferase HicA
MKYSEVRKWLKQQGATFEKHRSGSSHYRVLLNGRSTIFPDHGAKEIGKGLVEAIKKQLGIKPARALSLAYYAHVPRKNGP